MLELINVNSYYDDVHVLRDFSLSVNAGEVLCMLGRNGAGKTTVLKTIMRLVELRSGKILLEQSPEKNSGKESASSNIDLATLLPHKIPHAGIGYVPQGRRLFSDLTVAENLTIGLMAGRQHKNLLEKIYGLFPILESRLKQKAGTLSGGEQQMLATARALCVDPRVLLLDEPTEGLQPSMIQTIRDVVTSLREEGVTIIIVEQRVDAVLSIADRVAFIENGQNRDTITVAELAKDPGLVKRYVGVSE